MGNKIKIGTLTAEDIDKIIQETRRETAIKIFDEIEKVANKNVEDPVLRKFMCFKIDGKAWKSLKSRFLKES